MTRTHDVVVLGGGLLGCSVARDLAIRGADVLVVEEPPENDGESYGLGVLAPDLADGTLAQAGLDLYPEWTATLEAVSGIDVGFSQCGGALVAFDPDEAQRLRILDPGTGEATKARHSLLTENATGLRTLDTAGHVDLANLARALTSAAERAGVAFTHDTVKQVVDEPRPTVVGTQARYAGAHVIAACPGPWELLAARCEIVRIPELEITGDGIGGHSVVLASERARLVSDGNGRVAVYGPPTPSSRGTSINLREVRVLMDAAMELVPSLQNAGLRRFRCALGVRDLEGGAIVGPMGRGRWGFGADPRLVGLLAPGGAQRLADLIQAD